MLLPRRNFLLFSHLLWTKALVSRLRKRPASRLVMGGVLLAMSVAAAAQQAPQPSPPGSSPRVTMHLKATPLTDAVKEVSRLTGVPLTVSEDTADLRVTILVKDLPLDTLQARLAETMHLTWLRLDATNEKPVSYRLYRSKENTAEELRLLERGESAFRKGIDEAIGVLAMPQNARAELFPKRPALETTFLQDGGELAVRLLSKIPLEVRASIMEGDKLEFPSGKPPPEYVPYLREMMTALKPAAANLPVNRLLEQDGTFSVVRTGEGAASIIGIGFSVQNETLNASLGFRVRGVDPEEVYPEFYAPDRSGPDYAEALRPIKIPAPWDVATLEDAMEKIADTQHINIIGESYAPNAARDTKRVEAGDSTLAQMLDDIRGSDRWWKQGDVYLFQAPQWWVVRRSQLSDAKLAVLTKLLAQRPATFEAMARIGKMISVEQERWLFPALKGNDFFFTDKLSAIRFYGNLSDAHKTAIFLKGGMDAAVLSDADRQRLRVWTRETDSQALQAIQKTPGTLHIQAIRLVNKMTRDPMKPIDPQEPVPFVVNQECVLFRAWFQANDGTKHVLREQIVTDGYLDPSDPRLHTQY